MMQRSKKRCEASDRDAAHPSMTIGTIGNLTRLHPILVYRNVNQRQYDISGNNNPPSKKRPL